MALLGAFQKRTSVRVVIAVMAIAIVTTACTSAGDTFREASATLPGGEGGSLEPTGRGIERGHRDPRCRTCRG